MAMEQPKKPVGGSFGQFLSEKRPEFAKQCVGQPTSAVSKLAGEEWKKLTEAQKAPYQVKYEAAKKKFDEDLAAFLAAGGEKKERKTKKDKVVKTVDPNKPKKPVGGAYGCYMAKHRAELQKECPGDVTGVAKLGGQRWKALPEKEKAVYEDEYRIKIDAYKEAMKSYVPPAGAEVEGEEDEDEEELSPKKDSPPKKRAKSAEPAAAPPSKRGRGRKSPAEEEPTIPADVLKRAEGLNMIAQLKNLMGRAEVKASGKSPKDMLGALEASSGLVNKAKAQLCGA